MARILLYGGLAIVAALVVTQQRHHRLADQTRDVRNTWAASPRSLYLAAGYTVELSGSEMEPTLRAGTRVRLDRLVGTPQVGDLVSYDARRAGVAPCAKRAVTGAMCSTAGPGDRTRVYLGRVMAQAGDRVSMRHGWLVRNGRLVRDRFGGCRVYGCDTRPITVPPGTWVVLSDNRRVAVDSRVVGPLPREQIQSRVVTLPTYTGAWSR